MGGDAPPVEDSHTQDGQFGSNGQSIFSVRQVAPWRKATGILAARPYEAKFEFDLYGTGADEGKTTFHVRHMYAKWGPFLAGQTNTLWMDGDIFPTSSNIGDRPGMVWTCATRNPLDVLEDKDGWMAAVALEHPSNDIDPGNVRLIDEDIATNIQADEKVPDLTAAIRYTGNWGHVQARGHPAQGRLRHEGHDDNEPKGHKTGWGLDATTAIKISPATLKLGVVYGRGIATYMNDGGMDLAPAASTYPRVPDFPAAAAASCLRWWIRSRAAARHHRLRRLPMVEGLDLLDRLQHDEGQQHQLPGAGSLPQGRICARQTSCGPRSIR